MRKNKSLMFSQVQLITIRRAVEVLGKKWGEPITTEYTDGIIEIIDNEINARQKEKERIEIAFSKIAIDYEGDISDDGAFEMEGE